MDLFVLSDYVRRTHPNFPDPGYSAFPVIVASIKYLLAHYSKERFKYAEPAHVHPNQNVINYRR